MKPGERWILGSAGVCSWVAGAVATFAGGSGPPAVALIGAGAASGALALIGRWPTRIVISGHEVSWLAEEVQEKLEEAEDAGDDARVAVLTELKRDLEQAHRTGSLPRHPAAAYDDDLRDALQRILPGTEIVSSTERSRGRADFTLSRGGITLLVESKYKSNVREPFRGSTLEPLLHTIGPSERLLVVTNAIDVERAARVVATRLAERGQVVSWLGPLDDDALRTAVRRLVPSNDERRR